MNGELTLHARTAADWRAWLETNAAAQRSVWLIIYHKRSPTPSVLVPEAVEQALCFGWIDSHAKKRDAESFYLRFTPRRPRSNWSRVNRARAEKLIAEGLMRPAGQAQIDLAKQTGRWPQLHADPRQPENAAANNRDRGRRPRSVRAPES